MSIYMCIYTYIYMYIYLYSSNFKEALPTGSTG